MPFQRSNILLQVLQFLGVMDLPTIQAGFCKLDLSALLFDFLLALLQQMVCFPESILGRGEEIGDGPQLCVIFEGLLDRLQTRTGLIHLAIHLL